MLARLLFREETYSSPRQGLRSGRYIRTVNCSATEEGCTLRYAHDSLRTNYVSKLAMAYERDLGVTQDWNSALRTGNAVRSDLVTQYMAFIRENQKKEGFND